MTKLGRPTSVNIGDRIGNWFVLKRKNSPGTHVMWECLCDCGLRMVLRGSRLKRGQPKHCGCQYTYRETRTYKTWQAMRARCYNPHNNRYHRYGKRGIVVCDRWRFSFKNFRKDMGEKPIGMSLDRYPNPDGNYEPSNCRWATPKQQAQNKSED